MLTDLARRPAEIVILSDKIQEAPTTLLVPPIVAALLLLWHQLRVKLEIWSDQHNSFVFTACRPSGRDTLYAMLNQNFNRWLHTELKFPAGKTAHFLRNIVIADASARFGRDKTMLELLATSMRHSVGTAKRFYDTQLSYGRSIAAQTALLQARGHINAIPLLATPPSSDALPTADNAHLALGVFTPAPLPMIPPVPRQLVDLIFTFMQLAEQATGMATDNPHQRLSVVVAPVTSNDEGEPTVPDVDEDVEDERQLQEMLASNAVLEVTPQAPILHVTFATREPDAIVEGSGAAAAEHEAELISPTLSMFPNFPAAQPQSGPAVDGQEPPQAGSSKRKRGGDNGAGDEGAEDDF